MPLFAEKIFFSNPMDQFRSHKAEILAAVEDVCEKGPHILGKAVETFENEFAAWNNVKYAVGVASGTDALAIAMRSFGIGAGDEVITVSHTALATASAIIMSGARPVLVDINPETMLIDPSKLESAISPKTKAIVAVHLYGYACPMNEILAFAKKHGLIVIEDCAQAHGATYKGKKVGSMGDAGCFSFYPTKNLGAIGDGGAIITNNADLAENMKRRRQYGWDNQRVAYETGELSRLDSLQAAILSIKLKNLEADTQKRRDIAAIYDKALDQKKFGHAKALPDTNPAYHLYVITADQRDTLKASLAPENVELGIHYTHPVHWNPGYVQKVRIPDSGLPHTEKAAQSVLSLPIYPEMPHEYARIIADALNARQS